MSVTLTRRAVLAGSTAAAAVALPAAAVQAMSRAAEPAVAAWRQWLDLKRAAARVYHEYERRLAALPEDLRRARVVGGRWRPEPDGPAETIWVHSEAEIDICAVSPPWPAELVRARKEELAASRRVVADAHAEAGLPALLREWDELEGRVYDLGYTLAETTSAGPLDVAAQAWVAAGALLAGAEWDCLPAAAFAAQLRAALPLLPADLHQAVETALAADIVAEGFRRVIKGNGDAQV